ncbi:HEAT repeat domain-containing protein [Saccharibacillus alkalitolerans]|uniref:HEAT repeat domain-containing protein n=1 Tax=Saccharibacillus alkalitolerans TaxID=2705290 RepID=A0ABX0F9Q7_9BACL|nr:HEAT repeat domain-containing protein [Saccharibacillus alkalitolerans]NGZ77677.1 HEAT repeat domain-containing protein [Saccharibacillus alkalitolerans]
MTIENKLRRLGAALPERAADALERHARLQREKEFALRLMGEEEIREMLDAIGGIDVFRYLLPLWTDDNSNYAAVYFGGPLEGRVCYLNHGETDNSPAFRSVESFVARLEQDERQDWDDLQKEYPYPADVPQSEADARSVRELFDLLEQADLDEDVRTQQAFGLMALTSRDKLPVLLPFLEDEDPYVRERAAEIFKHHGVSPGKLKRDLTLNANENENHKE